MYITREYLAKYRSLISNSYADVLKQRSIELLKSQKDSFRRTIFLSHSHKDKELVEQVALLLLDTGTFLYVDWKDSSMPDITSAKTADAIKKKIESCDEFVVLASNNALDSKWVPWELGYADAVKGMANLYIFPVADNDGTWIGSEYFDLYQKIELGAEKDSGRFTEFVVREADHWFIATSLKYKFGQNSDLGFYFTR